MIPKSIHNNKAAHNDKGTDSIVNRYWFQSVGEIVEAIGEGEESKTKLVLEVVVYFMGED